MGELVTGCTPLGGPHSLRTDIFPEIGSRETTDIFDANLGMRPWGVSYIPPISLEPLAT